MVRKASNIDQRISDFASNADKEKSVNPQRKKAPGSKSINVYFTAQQHAEIKALAEREGRSIQKQIIHSLFVDKYSAE